MIGTIINASAVIVGSSIGLLLNKNLPEKYLKPVFQSIGLLTLVLGIAMAIKAENFVALIISLILGVLIGEFFEIQSGIEVLGERLKKLTKSQNSNFTSGLVTAFVLYCMGALTFLGAIEEGMGKSPDLLLAKSVLDGISSIALAAALGSGVLFSAIPLFIFQGAITLSASALKDFATTKLLNELSATGGVLLLALGLNILELKKFKVANFLPSLILIVIVTFIWELFV